MDEVTTARTEVPLVETRETLPRHQALAILAEAVSVFRGFENWLPVSWRLLVGRLRTRPPALRLRARSGPILETLAGDRSWRTCVEVFGRDCYHLADLRLPAAPTVVVIGANLGSFTVAVRAAWPQAQIISFEPSPTAFGMLALNVRRNESNGGRSTLHQAAVTGLGAGPTVQLTERAGDLCTSSIFPGAPGEAVDNTIEVPARSLADVLADCPRGVDLVKIDAEGAEYDIVCTTPPAMLRAARQLVIEYHPLAGRSFEELAQHLRAAGFYCSRRVRSALPGQGLAWWERPAEEG
ncbi:MAG TPA: FkbM family methyltransferase [Candidatus Dormibacteraeota bacterium]|nr:FkbM family methyltransferase [Candidatus Dormibacteraeota bacterium]